MQNKGFLSLILHAHLPFVRHPEHPEFLEEDWLFEAITETYVPLYDSFRKLADEGIHYRITMSITPTLCEMLCDELLQERYRKRLNLLIELCENELERKSGTVFFPTAEMYYHQLKNVKQIYEEECGSNLIEAFSHLQKRGNLEIITCAATHGFLPLFSHPACVRAQLKMAVKNYEKHFGCRPNGVWLPECGYEKGLDKELVNVGLKYFFLDSHGILYGNPRPKYGVFAPVKCKSGAVAFGRDIESSRAVWSSQTGYPGDPAYREFYRDIGHDESIDYVGKYLGEDRERKNLGIKYFRITGHHVELGDKEPYNPEMALMRAAEHANNFIFNRKRQVQFLNDNLDRSPLIVSPYDAELFGHWWYEGPVFIENVLRGLADPRAGIEPITPSMYMERFPEIQTIQPSPSSWGDKGYYEMWLNGTNDWIYKLLHKAEKRMVKIAYENKDADCEIKKCLNQASRELMLAQASDWAFIMTTGTMVEYAEKRTKDHVTRFNELCDMVDAKNIDNKKFNEIKAMDNIFPEMDFSIYL